MVINIQFLSYLSGGAAFLFLAVLVGLSRTGDKAGAQKMLKDILDTGRQFDAIEAARKLYAELATK